MLMDRKVPHDKDILDRQIDILNKISVKIPTVFVLWNLSNWFKVNMKQQRAKNSLKLLKKNKTCPTTYQALLWRYSTEVCEALGQRQTSLTHGTEKGDKSVCKSGCSVCKYRTWFIDRISVLKGGTNPLMMLGKGGYSYGKKRKSLLHIKHKTNFS